MSDNGKSVPVDLDIRTVLKAMLAVNAQVLQQNELLVRALVGNNALAVARSEGIIQDVPLSAIFPDLTPEETAMVQDMSAQNLANLRREYARQSATADAEGAVDNET